MYLIPIILKSNLISALTDEGSTSWRAPLAIQIIPAIILAFGCLFLPPSPRLLIIQGKNEEALSALARLRLRKPEEEDSDPLLKVCKRRYYNYYGESRSETNVFISYRYLKYLCEKDRILRDAS